MQTGPDQLDALFAVLADPTRRALVSVLDESESTDVSAAAGTLAGDGDGGDSAQLAVSLHHSHLPKMAAAGVIEYDPQSGKIQPAEAVTAVQQLLDRVDDDGSPDEP